MGMGATVMISSSGYWALGPVINASAFVSLHLGKMIMNSLCGCMTPPHHVPFTRHCQGPPH